MENKTNKLYFLAMGMNYTEEKNTDMKGSDIGNYRIRTTFHDSRGDVIFIEATRGYEREKKGNQYIITNNIKLHIDHLFNKTISDDENKSHIKPNEKYLKNYTKKDLLYFINKQFNTNYDEIVVVSSLSQFDYNKTTGDEFILDTEKLAKVMEIDKYFYSYEKETRKKEYPNYSIYWNDEKLEVLLHYNCYNDIVIIDDVYNYNFDYKKPDEEILKNAALSHGCQYRKEL